MVVVFFALISDKEPENDGQYGTQNVYAMMQEEKQSN
jgi:hypothetical protein